MAEYAAHDSTLRGLKFHIVRTRGEAELGNWLVASFFWKEDRDAFLKAVNTRGRRSKQADAKGE